MSVVPRRVSPEAPSRRGWCPSLARPMPTGDGLLARVHPPLGQLEVAQIRAVAEAARRFGNGHVDVTARGNLQIRGVTEATVPALTARLTAAGLGDVRGDGGPQRLTLTSPLAGLDGAVDVLTLAASIETASLGVPGLPAKTLVAIEGAGLGRGDADLSLHPAGDGTVRVALAGSGADRVVVTEPDAATVVAAILRAFAASGARRVRDLGDDERAALLNGVGGGSAVPQDATAERPISLSRPHPEVLRSSLEGDLQKPPRSLESSFEAADAADQDRNSSCRPASEVPRSSFEDAFQSASAIPGGLLRGSAIASHLRMRSREGSAATTYGPDTQDRVRSGDRTDRPTSVDGSVQISAGLIPLRDGRVAVAVEAPFGRCDAGAFDRLADIATQKASGHPVRTSPNRGFVLVCDTPEHAADALRRLAEAGFVTEPGDPRRAVAACPGAPACASGSTSTLDDAGRLAQVFGPLAESGLSAHVSGCAKGCAKPGPADLTLVGNHGRYGIVLRGPPGALPAFELTFEAALDRVRRAASTLSLDDAFRTTP